MAKFTPEQIAAIAEQLAGVAAVFAPGSAMAIGLLIKAGAELNTLVGAIKAQTEADAPEVWAQVQRDFSDAVSVWDASKTE